MKKKAKPGMFDVDKFYCWMLGLKHEDRITNPPVYNPEIIKDRKPNKK